MVLRTYNLATSEPDTIAEPNLRPLVSSELVLLPTESVSDLARLEEKWAEQFPGGSMLLLTLRQDLIRTDFHRSRARTLFEQCKCDLLWSALPMLHWDRPTLHHYQFLEKHQDRAEAAFHRALTTIQAVHKAAESTAQAKSAAQAKQEKLEPPPIVFNQRSVCFNQYAKIEIIDGKVVTTCNYDAKFCLEDPAKHFVATYTRHYHFPDRIIPEPYQYVLTQGAATYKPAESFFLSYKPEEFLRLCQLELDTQSEYLLDGGIRKYYLRRDC